MGYPRKKDQKQELRKDMKMADLRYTATTLYTANAELHKISEILFYSAKNEDSYAKERIRKVEYLLGSALEDMEEPEAKDGESIYEWCEMALTLLPAVRQASTPDFLTCNLIQEIVQITETANSLAFKEAGKVA